jgi:hypothetical protein
VIDAQADADLFTQSVIMVARNKSKELQAGVKTHGVQKICTPEGFA